MPKPPAKRKSFDDLAEDCDCCEAECGCGDCEACKDPTVEVARQDPGHLQPVAKPKGKRRT